MASSPNSQGQKRVFQKTLLSVFGKKPEKCKSDRDKETNPRNRNCVGNVESKRCNPDPSSTVCTETGKKVSAGQDSKYYLDRDYRRGQVFKNGQSHQNFYSQCPSKRLGTAMSQRKPESHHHSHKTSTSPKTINLSPDCELFKKAIVINDSSDGMNEKILSGQSQVQSELLTQAVNSDLPDLITSGHHTVCDKNDCECLENQCDKSAVDDRELKDRNDSPIDELEYLVISRKDKHGEINVVNNGSNVRDGSSDVRISLKQTKLKKYGSPSTPREELTRTSKCLVNVLSEDMPDSPNRSHLSCNLKTPKRNSMGNNSNSHTDERHRKESPLEKYGQEVRNSLEQVMEEQELRPRERNKNGLNPENWDKDIIKTGQQVRLAMPRGSESLQLSSDRRCNMPGETNLPQHKKVQEKNSGTTNDNATQIEVVSSEAHGKCTNQECNSGECILPCRRENEKAVQETKSNPSCNEKLVALYEIYKTEAEADTKSRPQSRLKNRKDQKKLAMCMNSRNTENILNGKISGNCFSSESPEKERKVGFQEEKGRESDTLTIITTSTQVLKRNKHSSFETDSTETRQSSSGQIGSACAKNEETEHNQLRQHFQHADMKKICSQRRNPQSLIHQPHFRYKHRCESSSHACDEEDDLQYLSNKKDIYSRTKNESTLRSYGGEQDKGCFHDTESTIQNYREEPLVHCANTRLLDDGKKSPEFKGYNTESTTLLKKNVSHNVTVKSDYQIHRITPPLDTLEEKEIVDLYEDSLSAEFSMDVALDKKRAVKYEQSGNEDSIHSPPFSDTGRHQLYSNSSSSTEPNNANLSNNKFDDGMDSQSDSESFSSIRVISPDNPQGKVNAPCSSYPPSHLYHQYPSYYTSHRHDYMEQGCKRSIPKVFSHQYAFLDELALQPSEDLTKNMNVLRFLESCSYKMRGSFHEEVSPLCGIISFGLLYPENGHSGHLNSPWTPFQTYPPTMYPTYTQQAWPYWPLHHMNASRTEIMDQQHPYQLKPDAPNCNQSSKFNYDNQGVYQYSSQDCMTNLFYQGMDLQHKNLSSHEMRKRYVENEDVPPNENLYQQPVKLQRLSRVGRDRERNSEKTSSDSTVREDNITSPVSKDFKAQSKDSQGNTLGISNFLTPKHLENSWKGSDHRELQKRNLYSPTNIAADNSNNNYELPKQSLDEGIRWEMSKPSTSISPATEANGNISESVSVLAKKQDPVNFANNSKSLALSRSKSSNSLGSKNQALAMTDFLETSRSAGRSAGSDCSNWRDNCKPMGNADPDFSRSGDIANFRSEMTKKTAWQKKRRSDSVILERRHNQPNTESESSVKKAGQLGRQSEMSFSSEHLDSNAGLKKQCFIQLRERSKRYQYTFIDTHCHIDFLYSRMPVDADKSFDTFREENTFPINFEGCIAIFCNPWTFTLPYPREKYIKVVQNHPTVWLAFGCHPKSAEDFDEPQYCGLERALNYPNVVALGEIGLDYSNGFSRSAEKQKKVFIEQLKLAVKRKLPLIIHCRDADDDCLNILKENVPRHHKIHAHCFTRGIVMAKRWLDAFPNLWLGLTPVISYRSAYEAKETAKHVPLDRVLLETDAPYFVPDSFRGVRHSHPGLALCTAETIAQLRQISVDEVLEACRKNTKAMYGI